MFVNIEMMTLFQQSKYNAVCLLTQHNDRIYNCYLYGVHVVIGEGRLC